MCKKALTSFSQIFCPQNILAFSFNRFATLMNSFKAIFSLSSRPLNLNQSNPSKIYFFGHIFIKLKLR